MVFLICIAPLLLFIGFLLLRSNYANYKGKIGEISVSSILSLLPQKEYRIYNNIYINQFERSVQIDHIILSFYGIFVIETKNFSGWIYGTDESEYWTKNMYGNKYKFRNPIKQNFSHVKTLSYLFNLDTMYFVPVVVFIDRATLKNNTKANVIYASQLYSFIKSYKDSIFNETELDNLTQILSETNITDKDYRKEHIIKVRESINERESLIYNHICPRCKGKLVERHGKYGTFLGCSNYPKCKFTSNQY